jgi:hypothetical protein
MRSISAHDLRQALLAHDLDRHSGVKI